MIGRRHFLAGAGAALAFPAIVRAQGFSFYPFTLGVAAGDPSPDGFVIWTRLAPEPLQRGGGMAMNPVEVSWEVAADARFATIVARGDAVARPELGHSVHVELSGLEADRSYWYRFRCEGERSIQGHARTLPVASARPSSLRFGVCGCQNFEEGYYTAYRHLAEEELAFVYHYGDYIYEYRGGWTRPGRGGQLIQSVRRHEGGTLYDIAEYRRRYAQVKSDPDLQRAHAAHAFFMTYDDHEIADNWVGDIVWPELPPEIFRTRRAMALQAWYENMPVRRALFPRHGELRAHRSIRFGNLAELNFLDTRQYRADQPCNDGFRPACENVNAPDATVLGAEQEEWLARNLSRRQARWNVLAQQVMMMALDRRMEDEPEPILNLDTWAAYRVPRDRLLARMAGLDNVVVLTGDEHQNFAGELVHRDRPVAVEFVSTSISSGGDGSDRRPGIERLLARNPQVRFNNDQRGYLACEVTPEIWQSHYMVMDHVSRPGGTLSKRASVAVEHGRPALIVP